MKSLYNFGSVICLSVAAVFATPAHAIVKPVAQILSEVTSGVLKRTEDIVRMRALRSAHRQGNLTLTKGLIEVGHREAVDAFANHLEVLDTDFRVFTNETLVSAILRGEQRVVSAEEWPDMGNWADSDRVFAFLDFQASLEEHLRELNRFLSRISRDTSIDEGIRSAVFRLYLERLGEWLPESSFLRSRSFAGILESEVAPLPILDIKEEIARAAVQDLDFADYSTLWTQYHLVSSWGAGDGLRHFRAGVAHDEFLDRVRRFTEVSDELAETLDGSFAENASEIQFLVNIVEGEGWLLPAAGRLETERNTAVRFLKGIYHSEKFPPQVADRIWERAMLEVRRVESRDDQRTLIYGLTDDLLGTLRPDGIRDRIFPILVRLLDKEGDYEFVWRVLGGHWGVLGENELTSLAEAAIRNAGTSDSLIQLDELSGLLKRIEKVRGQIPDRELEGFDRNVLDRIKRILRNSGTIDQMVAHIQTELSGTKRDRIQNALSETNGFRWTNSEKIRELFGPALERILEAEVEL